MKVFILSGPNHGFEKCAPVIGEFLGAADDIDISVENNKDILTSGLDDFDVCVFGTGFTRPVRLDDGHVQWKPELTPEQEDALFAFVANGKGLVGCHGTAWNISERAVSLLGGHANWHPPFTTFTVNIAEGDHPITVGVEDFEVDDEIYMSAWFPEIDILATAQWADKIASDGLDQSLRRRTGLLHHPGPQLRHLHTGRHATTDDPGRALGWQGHSFLG